LSRLTNSASVTDTDRSLSGLSATSDCPASASSALRQLGLGDVTRHAKLLTQLPAQTISPPHKKLAANLLRSTFARCSQSDFRSID
jgi:hypothetical protein